VLGFLQALYKSKRNQSVSRYCHLRNLYIGLYLVGAYMQHLAQTDFYFDFDFILGCTSSISR
jgi:hypothetical protein